MSVNHSFSSSEGQVGVKKSCFHDEFTEWWLQNERFIKIRIYKDGMNDEIYMDHDTKKVYGFFDCAASEQEVEAELHTIRECLNMPPHLEYSLIKDMDNLEGDDGLNALVEEAKKEDINYVFEVTNHGGTIEYTAGVVASILNQAYNSPLYKEKAPFRGEIICEENGDYLFRK